MALEQATIAAAWRRLAAELDPTIGDEEAQALLNSPGEQDKVRSALSYLDIVRQKQPGLFRAHDLSWAFDPNAHPRGLDAALYVRLSWQLAGLYESGISAPVMERLLTRHTFAFRSTSAPPRLIRSDGLCFIVIPFAFLELAQLLLRSFEIWLARGEDGADAWRALSGEAWTPPDVGDAPAPFRQATARWLTGDRFHPGRTGEEPSSALRARSPWFSESRELHALPAAGAFTEQLDYSLLDFALAHEAGHAMAGHEGQRSLEIELEADRQAFALYEAARLWRDEILDPCPLGAQARLALGPLAFTYFDLWRLSLWRSARQKFDLGPRTDGDAFKISLHESAIRRDAVERHLDAYTSWAQARDLISAGDLEQLHRLQQGMAAFTGQIARWSQAPADEDVSAVQSFLA